MQKYQFLVSEYELVKEKKHPNFKKVKHFYLAHNTCPQTFLKYYGRYKASDGEAYFCLENVAQNIKHDERAKK